MAAITVEWLATRLMATSRMARSLSSIFGLLLILAITQERDLALWRTYTAGLRGALPFRLTFAIADRLLVSPTDETAKKNVINLVSNGLVERLALRCAILFALSY
jgi:hypothetical protein